VVIEATNHFFRLAENYWILAVEGKWEYPISPLTVDGRAFVPLLLIIWSAFYISYYFDEKDNTNKVKIIISP
jgi:hypothetical protein